MKTKFLPRTLVVLTLILNGAMQAQTPAEPPDRATALAEARAGQWERAAPVLDALAAAEPVDVEVCALLTVRRLEENRAKEAVALAERAAAAAPDQAALQSLLGRALGQRVGELAFIQQGFVAPKMLRAFKRSVELDPDHVPGLIGLANYYLYSPAIAGGSFEKAEEYAQQVAKRDPFNGALTSASIQEKRENWSAAAARYREALVLQPGKAWLHARLGSTLVKAGQTAEAKAAFEAALQLQPGQAEARAGLEALVAPRS